MTYRPYYEGKVLYVVLLSLKTMFEIMGNQMIKISHMYDNQLDLQLSRLYYCQMCGIL